MGLIPLFSALVSLAFAAAVFDQYLTRRKPYQLVWTAGLLCFAVSTAMEFAAWAFGLSMPVYRLWYLFGAVFAAAYLGMGTLYLLTPRRVANIVMAFLLLASVLAIFRAWTAPVDLELVTGPVLSGKGFPSGLEGPRLFTPFFNVFGTLALVGGALYSAYVFWRRRLYPHRVLSNILIAVGAILPALAGSLARLGSPGYLYVSEFLGVVIIFIGFLRSREVFGLYRIPFSRGLRRAPD